MKSVFDTVEGRREARFVQREASIVKHSEQSTVLCLTTAEGGEGVRVVRLFWYS